MVDTPSHNKSKVVTLRVPPRELRAILGQPEIYSLPVEAQKERLEYLTHTALHLILGSKKRFPSIQILKKAGSPAVLDIAPAVWDARHFQVRRKVTPTKHGI